MSIAERTRVLETVEKDRPHPPTPAAEPPKTHLPRLEMTAETPDPGRVVVGLNRDDALSVLGAAVSGLAIGLLCTVVFGLIPVGWLLVVSFLWFMGIYATLVFLRHPGPAVIDRLWTVTFWAAGVVVIGSLAMVVGFTLVNGNEVFGQIFSPDFHGNFWDRFHFFTEDMGLVGPLGGLDTGGITYAIVGTLEQIGIALVITVPLGLTTAVFLNEVGGRFARFVRTVVEAMTALPSVVAGLFIYAAVIVLITREPSGFAASLAITVLMLPIMIRSSDVVLRLVPGNLREAGLALGAGQWSVVWRVVLPTVRSGLTTAIILATAHGIGETAPVLLTSGVTQNLNGNPFTGPQTSLPLAALKFIENSSHNLIVRGFATAAVLLALVLILFITARAIGGRAAGEVSQAQLRRLRAKSARSLTRIESIRTRVREADPPTNADPTTHAGEHE